LLVHSIFNYSQTSDDVVALTEIVANLRTQISELKSQSDVVVSPVLQLPVPPLPVANAAATGQWLQSDVEIHRDEHENEKYFI